MASSLARGVSCGPDLSGVVSDDSAPKRSGARNSVLNRDEESPRMIDDIVESLMSLLFWRRKRRFDVTANVQSIRAVSTTKLKPREDPDDEVNLYIVNLQCNVLMINV